MSVNLEFHRVLTSPRPQRALPSPDSSLASLPDNIFFHRCHQHQHLHHHHRHLHHRHQHHRHCHLHLQTNLCSLLRGTQFSWGWGEGPIAFNSTYGSRCTIYCHNKFWNRVAPFFAFGISTSSLKVLYQNG